MPPPAATPGSGSSGVAPRAPYTLCNACGIKHRRRGQSAAADAAAAAIAAASVSTSDAGDGNGGSGPRGPPPAPWPPSLTSPLPLQGRLCGPAAELAGMYAVGGRRRGVAKRAYVRRRRAEGAAWALPLPPDGLGGGGGARTASWSAGDGREAGGSGQLPPLPPSGVAAPPGVASAPDRGAGGGGGRSGCGWSPTLPVGLPSARPCGLLGGAVPPVAVAVAVGGGGGGAGGGPLPLLPSFASVLSASGLR